MQLPVGSGLLPTRTIIFPQKYAVQTALEQQDDGFILCYLIQKRGRCSLSSMTHKEETNKKGRLILSIEAEVVHAGFAYHSAIQ